ncbi:MAG: SdpI family protein [Ktedonobacteraceae bacterium]
MDPTENRSKIHPSAPYSSTTIVALLIIGLQIAIAAGTYPFLPAIVPSHWDAAGNVNGYLPKFTNALIVPLLSIGIFLLMRILLATGPRLTDQDPRATQRISSLLLIGILLFMLVMQIITLAIPLGLPINVSFVINLAVSILFIFIGNYLGKLQRNFWAGIRTPWTLSSDITWERTHRLGGWLFVGVGVLGIITAFVPFLRIWGVVSLVLLVSAILVIYSYVVYRQVETSDRNPLSPPIDV